MLMTPKTLPDIQSTPDTRRLVIDAAGVRDVRHPLSVRLRSGEVQRVAAKISMDVALPAEQKGTHMSRFIELLTPETERALDNQAVLELAVRMAERLHAKRGAMSLRFPLFLLKHAPVSRVPSYMDYEAGWEVQVEGEEAQLTLVLQAPVKSLCPCSKEISDYGAHNQRSLITMRVRSHELSFEELITIAEQQASCELWGVLKRPDEKYVTEHAYLNPKFVEDLVRDLAAALEREPRVKGYVVEAENYESIHNHSAYARIEAM